MEYKEVTEIIIGCAYRVYNKMEFGFFESVYQKCLLIVDGLPCFMCYRFYVVT
jgi:hypothetical protein